MEIVKEQVSRKRAVGRTTAGLKMSELMASGVFETTYKAILRYVEESGQSVDSAVAIYRNFDFARGTTDVTPGFFVPEGFQIGDWEEVILGAGEVYTTLYTGPYTNLHEPHMAVMREAQKDGYTVVLSLEEYVVGPASGVDELEYKTKVYHYVKRA